MLNGVPCGDTISGLEQRQRRGPPQIIMQTCRHHEGCRLQVTFRVIRRRGTPRTTSRGDWDSRRSPSRTTSLHALAAPPEPQEGDQVPLSQARREFAIREPRLRSKTLQALRHRGRCMRSLACIAMSAMACRSQSGGRRAAATYSGPVKLAANSWSVAAPYCAGSRRSVSGTRGCPLPCRKARNAAR